MPCTLRVRYAGAGESVCGAREAAAQKGLTLNAEQLKGGRRRDVYAARHRV